MDRQTRVSAEGPAASAASEQELSDLRERVQRWRAAIAAEYLGRAEVIDSLLWCALSGGHALIEGVPGLGKTTLVKAFARALDLSFARVQFTPDLMPGDVLGGRILDEDESGRRRLRFEPGPVFAHVVLADEINRAGPRTQSALLEAMAEGQVTSFGETRALPDPFLLVATQNPIELEGTYPLPEAQVDRFTFQIRIHEPDLNELTAVLSAPPRGARAPAPIANAAHLSRWRQLCAEVLTSSEIVDLAARLTMATSPRAGTAPEAILRGVRHGSSPRGGLALLATARARALTQGRLHVTPGDLEAVALPALRHRLVLSYEAQASGVDRDDLVRAAWEFAAKRDAARSKSGLD